MTDQIEHDDQDDAAFWARVTYILEQSIAALTPEDVAARIEHCQRTGQHGVRVEEADDTGLRMRFVWGGRTLAVVERDVFADDAYFEGLSLTRLPGAPDDASSLTDGGDA